MATILPGQRTPPSRWQRGRAKLGPPAAQSLIHVLARWTDIPSRALFWLLGREQCPRRMGGLSCGFQSSGDGQVTNEQAAKSAGQLRMRLVTSPQQGACDTPRGHLFAPCWGCRVA